MIRTMDIRSGAAIAAGGRLVLGSAIESDAKMISKLGCRQRRGCQKIFLSRRVAKGIDLSKMKVRTEKVQK